MLIERTGAKSGGVVLGVAETTKEVLQVELVQVSLAIESEIIQK